MQRVPHHAQLSAEITSSSRNATVARAEIRHPPGSWQIIRRRPRTPSRGALPGVLPPYGIACALPGLLLTSPRPTRHTKLKETVGALIETGLLAKTKAARAALDAWTREI